MKTYAEANNEPPFDWAAFLHQTSFTQEELNKADELASDWVTCACGNLCDAIPREKEMGDGGEKLEGSPIDRKLSTLGIDFMSAIRGMNEDIDLRLHAIDLLVKIEKRSSEILTEMGLLPAKP